MDRFKREVLPLEAFLLPNNSDYVKGELKRRSAAARGSGTSGAASSKAAAAATTPWQEPGTIENILGGAEDWPAPSKSYATSVARSRSSGGSRAPAFEFEFLCRGYLASPAPHPTPNESKGASPSPTLVPSLRVGVARSAVTSVGADSYSVLAAWGRVRVRRVGFGMVGGVGSSMAGGGAR
eukprot:15452227-Alexandrium_andersonii.AAC.1